MTIMEYFNLRLTISMNSSQLVKHLKKFEMTKDVNNHRKICRYLSQNSQNFQSNICQIFVALNAFENELHTENGHFVIFTVVNINL